MMKCFPLSSSERISVSRNGSQLLGGISLVRKIICYLNKEYGHFIIFGAETRDEWTERKELTRIGNEQKTTSHNACYTDHFTVEKFKTMSDLKKEILERSGFRVYVRKVVSTVRELLPEEDVENICPTLESHKINLEKQQKQIETLNEEIAELVGADAIEKEILDRCEFEASLQETISLISSQLSFAKESKNSAETTPSLNQQEAPIGAKTSSKAKLPKLTLPKFAGDPTEWTTFWDSFSSAIHLSEELSEIDKLQYLKSLLVGTAAETISGLPLSGSNYNLRG